ncbi:MAG: hypothetical protein ABI398_09095 [Devosia sp.]
MRIAKIVAIALVISAAISPVFAADAMMAGGDTMGMMAGGEVMTFMGDGHMGKAMVTDQAMMDSMMKMAKPIDGCLIIMTGKDGKTYMVTPTSKDEMAQCEKMAM